MRGGMILPVVCEGDRESFSDCSEDHPGGTYTLTGGSMNPILMVRGKWVIVRGQLWYAHCPASAGTATKAHPTLKVRGVSVCLKGDRSTSGCHGSGGIEAKQTLFTAPS